MSTQTKAVPAKASKAKATAAQKRSAAKKVALEAINSVKGAEVPFNLSWYNKLKEHKARQKLHYHTLGTALKSAGIEMLDSEGSKYNFNDDIVVGRATAAAEPDGEDTKWGIWAPKELHAYERILSGKEAPGKHGKHALGVLAAMHKLGYTFK